MPHCIRLRAGWIRQIGPAQTKVGLPDDSPGSPDAEKVSYRRTFNCPTGLDDQSRVSLVVENWTGTLQARLDDAPLCDPLRPAEAPFRVAVAERLHGHHQLTIELTPSETGAAGQLTGIVFLEIHA